MPKVKNWLISILCFYSFFCISLVVFICFVSLNFGIAQNLSVLVKANTINFFNHSIAEDNFVQNPINDYSFLFAAANKSKKNKRKLPTGTEDIKKVLESEKEKAKINQDSFLKLTAREKTVNLELVELEEKILGLEKQVNTQEKKIHLVQGTQGENWKRYLNLSAVREAIEVNISQLLDYLWHVYIRQNSIGLKDGKSFSDSQREYLWTLEILGQIAKQQDELKNQEVAISKTLSERELLAIEAKQELEQLKIKQDVLLNEKLRFHKELLIIRQEKESIESALKNILEIVESLNLSLKETTEEKEKKKTSLSKGSLLLPASGKIGISYNANAKPPMRGVGFSLEPNEPVRAVAFGRVVHSDILRGLGHVVVLMHDESYYTVYGHLDSSPLSVGQEVATGQEIGKAGYYPTVKGNGLYFELRHQQQTLDPVLWFQQ